MFTTIKSHIASWEGALNPKACSELINLVEAKMKWQSSQTNGGFDSMYRSNDQTHITLESSVDSDFKHYDEIIYTVMNKAVVEYQRLYGSFDLVSEDEGYSLLRYKDSQEYKVHTDSASHNKRLISALLYLNEDFEGGETDFPLQTYKVKPKTGMLTLFPSIYTHPHASLPVQGTKYVIVTWFKGF